MAMERRGVREGMIVYSADGEKLGKVLECRTDGFIIEKGLLFPKDYLAHYEDVAEAGGDEIRLGLAKEAFTARTREGGWKERIEEKLPGAPGDEQVRMPIAEEELEVEKHERPAGGVGLKKEVVTEKERVEVPVMKEQVRVERVPATERTPATREGAFEEKTASVPLHEEEVEIRKRPVVKEEVRLQKERQVEQRAADVDVRKERVAIEGEGARPARTEEEAPEGGRIDPDRGR